MSIYKDEFIEIVIENDKAYIQSFREGFNLKNFEAILRTLPRIKLTKFTVLKQISTHVSDKREEFGVWLPLVDVQITSNKLEASIIVNESKQYIQDNRESVLAEIEAVLNKASITYGRQVIKLDEIETGKPIIIATGTPSKAGEDAKITYLELPERRPVIREDGKADYFDMNFIFEIKEDMWLGEKIPATEGIPGTAVDGTLIKPAPGRDGQLKYDHQSAYEVEENGKVVLRARMNGVLEQVKGLISVNQHLPINGDVGLETGNINFDGSVSVRGTVLSGYSIVAKGDISIEAPEGVTGAKLIKSVDGDVYIRGGIFGLGETKVEAGGHIFVKHVNEANLKADEDITIGFYAIGSNLIANSIHLDPNKGKIVGGTAIAKQSITVAIAGNRLERRTELILNSLNKQDAMLVIQERAATLKKVQEETLQIEIAVNRYNGHEEELNSNQQLAFGQAKEAIIKNNKYIDELDREIKMLMADLRNSGQEEINVTKEAYPGTYIQIGKKSTVFTKVKKGKFKLEVGELNV